ncbi:hypothetical protein [Oscillatoria salina]|uniref:hypothetical protein n=1 Tax=Oscillatoria salina TaxID=331517 RepID=UPI0013B74C74|nr:hypothetical protein [Oscillatoria salina]MBZ8180545.1 hypothetical protein [Oscillatoria salina IIICB1]NET90239.1 hypothetical protein [Kamptonema sp. SIO1D9]
MLVFETFLEGAKEQDEKLDEAIRPTRIVCHSCHKCWLNKCRIRKKELSSYCSVLGYESKTTGWKLSSFPDRETLS